jgi:CHAT domain-containing protein/tetratricopeptide (TPR) repeat protein
VTAALPSARGCIATALLTLLACMSSPPAPAAAQTGANPGLSLTELFVTSWIPETGPPHTAPIGEARELARVAGLAQRGHLNRAWLLLDTLEARADAPSVRYAVLLFRRHLAANRFPQGVLGDVGLAALRSQTTTDSLDALLRGLYPRMSNGGDAYVAYLASLRATECLARFPSLPLLYAPPAGLTSQVEDQARQLCREWARQSASAAVTLPLLAPDQLTRLDALQDAAVAVSVQDYAAAAQHLDRGLVLAQASSDRDAEVRFLRRRGDLALLPFVSRIAWGPDAEPQGSPELGAALNRAAAAYRQAEGHSGEEPASLLRAGHLAQAAGRLDEAVALYGRAAALGATQDRPRERGIALAGSALLTGDADALTAAMGELTAAGDLRGTVFIAWMAQSYASRQMSVYGDLSAATRTLRIAADALLANGLKRSASDLLETLATVYRTAGRAEAAIQALDDAIALHREFLREVNALAVARGPGGAVGPASLARLEERGLGLRLSQLLTEVEWRVIEEGYADWGAKKDSLLEEVRQNRRAAYAGVPALESGAAFVESASPINRELRRAEALVLDCPTYLRETAPLVARADSLNSNGLSVTIHGARSRCDPGERAHVGRLLERVSPVDSVREILGATYFVIEAARQGQLQTRMFELKTAMEWALRVGRQDLVERWLADLGVLARDSVTLRRLTVQFDRYPAAVLIARGRPVEARRLLLDLISNGAAWRLRGVDENIAILEALIEADSHLGEAREALWAFEVAGELQRWQRAQRSGIQTDRRESAKQAMLERRAARRERLSAADLAELTRLRLQRSAPVPPPSPGRVQDLDLGGPDDVTVVAYHTTPTAVVAWRWSGREPPRIYRLSAQVTDIARARTGLLDIISNDLGDDWRAHAEALHAMLVAPLGAFPDSARLAILGADDLGGIPFELLGATPASMLMKAHAITYVERIRGGVARPTTPRPRRPHDALVAGINSEGLVDAENEVRLVSRHVGVDPLLGDSVTADKITALLPSARYVHLATHAIIDSENPYLSYLVLGGGERFEAWQIFRDTPAAELVVLSGCRTRHQPRGEGGAPISGTTSLAGFASSAGARWVVSTLWQASDQTTSRVMDEMYRTMFDDGLDVPRALQRAKLSVEEESSPFFYAHLLLSAHDLTAF